MQSANSCVFSPTIFTISISIYFVKTIDSIPRTNPPTENALREKLCPCPNLPENVSRLYRYDRVTKKCYRGGDKGPCGENMLFYGEAGNKVYGICDCDVLNKERALIFRGDPDSCHFVFTQGYCSANQWLTFNQNDTPACEPNKCQKNSRRPGEEFVPFRGRCVQVGSSVPECAEGEVVSFVRNKLEPACAVIRTNGITTLTLAVPRFRCTPGSRQSVTGLCQPVIKYNLS